MTVQVQKQSQLSDTKYILYAVFQETIKNSVILQCTNVKTLYHPYELKYHNK